MTERNGWPCQPGVPMNDESNGWHWVCGHSPAEKPHPQFWSRHSSGLFSWWSGRMWREDAAARHWRYLGPCLTPDEVDARVSEARRVALFDAHQRALLYANTSHHHRHLPVNPHECAAQVAMEIAGSISGIDPDIRKAGYAFRRKVLETAAQKAEIVIATGGPWPNIPAAIRALIDVPSEVIIRAVTRARRVI
jgi:hypothetical protein